MPWNYWHNLIVQPFGGSLKWAQPPTSSDMSPFPDCYWGWDEQSLYYGPQIVADDWLCTDDRPITDIHWWGSYDAWDQEYPPPTAPRRFHIAIWTDVPANPPEFSHPDTVVYEWAVDRAELFERRVGCDFHPETMNVPDACFRYDFYIPQAEWFHQQPGPTVYWISISAIYDVAEIPPNPWGWKTREHYYNDDAVRIFDPLAPQLGSVYGAGDPIEDQGGNSWDMAFVLTTDREPALSKLKWDQPPEPANPPDVYYGWNEYSVWDNETGLGKLVADDWYCDTDDPVTTIRWWGSFVGWRSATPPPNMPDHFHLTIWDEARVCSDPIYGPYSCPNRVIHEIICYNFTVQWVGWDYNPATNEYESCFLFEQVLMPEEYFYQTAGGNIYWLSIGAHYMLGTPPPYPWGWKTRPRDPTSPAPDDAVRIFDPQAPTLGSMYIQGEPMWWPNPVPEDSWDVAFELIATPQGSGTIYKWEQPPDLSPEGMDVNASAGVGGPGYILADDFLCTQDGPLTDFHIYGSWLNDVLPGDPHDVLFTISIHADIPAAPPLVPYSRPGQLLWAQPFGPFTFVATPIATGLQEGWMTPPDDYTPFGDTICWRYDFGVDAADAFQQVAGTIYWVDVQAEPIGAPGQSQFGWKTSPQHWNDAAVWGLGVEPFLGPWNMLVYPPQHPMAGQPIDLAFDITGSALAGEPYVKWSQPPQPYNPPDGFNGWNELSVYRGLQIAADDWYCDTDEPVTDVHWWGSFIDWGYKTPPELPIAFHLAVWTDQMCTDPTGTEFSCPGVVLWENYCETFEVDWVGWDWDPRDPTAPPEACFYFTQYLDEAEWFYQEPGGNIYWLSISAVYAAGAQPAYPWGWKTVPRDLTSPAPDDAVRISDPTAPTVGSVYGMGSPLYYSTPAESWDLAFQLTTLACQLPGDVNMDGVINGLDIQCFVDCLVNGSPQPGCNCSCCDMQPDGYDDTLDVPIFVSTLLIGP